MIIKLPFRKSHNLQNGNKLITKLLQPLLHVEAGTGFLQFITSLSTACSALTRLLYELTRLGCAKGRADTEQLKLFAGILRMTRRK